MSQPAAVDPWIAFQKFAKKTTPPTDISGFSQTRLIDFEKVAYNGKFGWVVKVGTIKTPTGYGVSWSNQVNTKESYEYGFQVAMVWAPMWNT